MCSLRGCVVCVGVCGVCVCRMRMWSVCGVCIGCVGVW